jgi:hypothetical protein
MTEPTPINPTQSQTIGKLAEALARVQANLPEIERDRTVEVTQKNGGTYSYSYVTLAALSKAVLPLLAANGLSYVVLPGAGSDGKMAVRYRLMHVSGEFLAGEFPVAGEGGIQMVGGRITYARRYVLAALTGVAADEDDEARLAEGDGPRTAQRAPAQRGTKAAKAAAPRPAERPAADAPALPDEGGTTEVQRGRGGLITEPMTRKLAILMNQVIEGRPSDHRQFIKDMTGREVPTRKDLTFDEGRALIDAFEKAMQTDNPIVEVIDIYRRTTGAAVASADMPQTAREQTRAAVLGRPAGPGDDAPPWETEAPPLPGDV